MSREKFEEWFKDTGYKFTAPRLYDAWLAGRESMRQEITPIIFGQCDSDNVAQRTVDAIRKIEP